MKLELKTKPKQREPLPDRAFGLMAILLVPIIMMGAYAMSQSTYEQEHPTIRALRILQTANNLEMVRTWSSWDFFYMGSTAMYQWLGALYLLWKTTQNKQYEDAGDQKMVNICTILYMGFLFGWMMGAEYLWGNPGCYVLPPDKSCSMLVQAKIQMNVTRTTPLQYIVISQ